MIPERCLKIQLNTRNKPTCQSKPYVFETQKRKCFVITHWRQNRAGVFINVLQFYWITPILFLEKSAAVSQFCFLCNKAVFFISAPTLKYHLLFSCLFTISNIYLIPVKGKTSWWKQPLKTNDILQGLEHKHLTHQINKIIKLHKSPCHSTRVPTVFHLVCLAARCSLSCWEMRRG